MCHGFEGGAGLARNGAWRKTDVGFYGGLERSVVLKLDRPPLVRAKRGALLS